MAAGKFRLIVLPFFIKTNSAVSTSLGFVSTACGSGRVKRMDSTIELKTHRPPQVVLTHGKLSFAGLM
jgi:hypothetical protein